MIVALKKGVTRQRSTANASFSCVQDRRPSPGLFEQGELQRYACWAIQIAMSKLAVEDASTQKSRCMADNCTVAGDRSKRLKFKKIRPALLHLITKVEGVKCAERLPCTSVGRQLQVCVART